MSRASAAGATRQSCTRCGAPVLRQTAGVPYNVTVDAVRHRPAEAAALTTPNRRAWCLRESTVSVRLVQIMPSVHNSDCPHPHVIEHSCPRTAGPGARSTDEVTGKTVRS